MVGARHVLKRKRSPRKPLGTQRTTVLPWSRPSTMYSKTWRSRPHLLRAGAREASVTPAARGPRLVLAYLGVAWLLGSSSSPASVRLIVSSQVASRSRQPPRSWKPAAHHPEQQGLPAGLVEHSTKARGRWDEHANHSTGRRPAGTVVAANDLLTRSASDPNPTLYLSRAPNIGAMMQLEVRRRSSTPQPVQIPEPTSRKRLAQRLRSLAGKRVTPSSRRHR
jgi:hypothetical protein